MRDFVLLATLGTSDVQVVFQPSDGPPKRFRIRRNDTRAFHEALRAGQIRYRFLSFEQTRQLGRAEKTDLAYHAAQRRLTTGLSGDESDEKGYVEIDCAEDEVLLCAPLFSDLQVAFEEVLDKQKFRDLQAILLLSTERSDAARYVQEPVAAIDLLRPYLAEQLAIAERHIRDCIFLRDGESLHERDKRGKVGVAAAAARRIDDAVDDLARTFGEAVAVINDVGGLPEIKPVLAASARYRFRSEVFFIHAGEDRQRVPRVPRTVSPDETLTVARQVDELLEQGAFGAAAHLAGLCEQDTLKQEPWRAHLRAVARWLSGEPLKENLPGDKRSQIASWYKQHASSLESFRGDLVRMAFRVESALQGEDWPAALRESFALFEAVRLERMRRQLSAGRRPCIDANGYRLDVERVRAGYREAIEKRWNKKKIPISQGGHQGNILTKIAEMFPDLFGDLVAWEAALGELRRFRNQAMHSALSAGDIDAVRRLAREQGLWEDAGLRFLKGKLLCDSFRRLGIAEPLPLYTGLLGALRKDMDAFSLGRHQASA